MAYLGRTELKSSDIQLKASTTISGSSTDTVVLTWTAANEQSLILKVNGVVQHTDAYSIAGSPTTITLASGNFADAAVVEVVGINDIGKAIVPADSSVTVAKLATTGTPDGSKFLQDDMAWTTVDSLPSQTGESGKFLTTNGTAASWATAGGDNTPSFGAYLAANQSLSNDTWTKITMNTEEWDTDGAFDHVGPNYKFTVPDGESGKYSFSLTSTLDDVGGTDALSKGRLALYKNGSNFKNIVNLDSAGKTDKYGIQLTAVLDLSDNGVSANDYIEFYVYINQNASDGNALGGQSFTFCSGYKLL